MDLAAHNIAYYLYINKQREECFFRVLHFASDGHYEKMMNEYFEYLFMADELRSAAKMMSINQHMIMADLIIKGLL